MRSRFLWVVILLPAFCHLGTVVIPLGLQHRLPDPIATHFSEGTPDEAGELWTVVKENLALSTTVWALLGLLAWLRPHGSIGRRAAAGLTLGMVVLLDASVMLGPVAGNLDAEVWRAASSPSYMPVIVVGGGALAVVLGVLAVSPLRRRQDDQDDLPAGPVTGPSLTGRTVWIGRSSCPPLFWKTLAATLLMGGVAVIGTRWLAVPAVLSLVTLHLWTGITAVFDGRRLTVRGRLPFLSIRRIGLDRIETAEAIEVDPHEWGWGWRLRSVRRHAVVIRKGEGLLVALRGGGEFVVTVDDAAAGAEEIRRALRERGPAHVTVRAESRPWRPRAAG